MSKLTDLATQLLDQGQRSAWVCLPSIKDAPEVYATGTNWKLFLPGETGDTIELTALTRPYGQRELRLYRVSPDSPWPFATGTLAEAQAGALAYEQALGITCLASPAATGRELLRRLSKRRLDQLAPTHQLDIDWPSEHDPSFASAPHPGRYLHAFDKNAAYLIATRDQSMGVGDPEGAGGYDPKAYGIWRVEGEADESDWNGTRAPSPFQSGCSFDGWAYTPTIELARSVGWRIHVAGGWVWRDRSRIFEQWGPRLWEARCQTTGLVRQAVKLTYSATIGQFRLTQAEQYGDRWYHQPHWRGWIMATNYVRMLAAYGKLPGAFAVHRDLLLCSSDEPDPWQASGLRADVKVGGFKHVGTLSDVAVPFDLSPARLEAWFKQEVTYGERS